MSTSPAVLPVDAPPPTPTVSPYPLGIASFQYPNYSNNVQAKEYDPTTPITAQFNVNSQKQPWGRTLQAGENPATFRLWGSIINGVFVPACIARTLGQAAVAQRRADEHPARHPVHSGQHGLLHAASHPDSDGSASPDREQSHPDYRECGS